MELIINYMEKVLSSSLLAFMMYLIPQSYCVYHFMSMAKHSKAAPCLVSLKCFPPTLLRGNV